VLPFQRKRKNLGEREKKNVKSRCYVSGSGFNES